MVENSSDPAFPGGATITPSPATLELIERVFAALDYEALGAIYCYEDGAEFWEERREPTMLAGSQWALALGARILPSRSKMPDDQARFALFQRMFPIPKIGIEQSIGGGDKIKPRRPAWAVSADDPVARAREADVEEAFCLAYLLLSLRRSLVRGEGIVLQLRPLHLLVELAS